MTSYLISIDFFSLSVFEISDFKAFRVWPWPSTFRGHLKLGQLRRQSRNLTTKKKIDAYKTMIRLVTFSGFDLDFRVWPLIFKSHLRSKIFSSFESSYMTSYLIYVDFFSLSRTVFEIFDFKAFRVWPWPSTFRGHLRSKVFPFFERPFMTSYLTSIDTFSLSRTVFEIFDFKVFRVWHWLLGLTFDL